MEAPQMVENVESVDAFMLYNERERDRVAPIVSQLTSLKVSTYFWRRDIPVGEPWEPYEIGQLRNAHTIVLFLGPGGWGPNHQRLAEEAHKLQKTILPVLIGQPPLEALEELGGLFRDRRYLDLSKGDTVEQLAAEIRRYTRGDAIETKTRPPPETPSWLNSFVKELQIGGMTPVARRVLQRAASIARPRDQSAQISSTRLMAAMHDIGQEIYAKRSVEPNADGYGLIAFAQALSSAGYMASYPEIVDPEIVGKNVSEASTTSGPIERVSSTKNVAVILGAASKITFGMPDTLSGDGLVVAFLRQPGTKAEERLTKDSIDWAGLPLAVFNRLRELDPARIDAWSAALNIAKPSAGPAPIVGATIAFAPLGNDNPDAETVDDKLGVADEAKAFARVAAARQVAPPLAFGIFGDWGSGKSFFMRLIKEHIDKLQDGTAREAKTGLFHENIVQIRFNAWHYVDSNLWASLVDYIFSELDRWVLKRLQPADQNTLFDKLATARDLTLESAERLVRRRRDQKIAAQRLTEAERQLDYARDAPKGAGRLFWAVVRSSFEKEISKKDLDAAAATLGLNHLASDAEALKKELDALKDEGIRAKVMANGIRQRLLAAPSLIIILLAIVFVPPALLGLREAITSRVSASGFVHTLVTDVNEIVLAVAGVLTTAAGILGVVTKHVRWALNKLEGYRTDLDKAIADQVKQPANEVKTAQAELDKLTADVAETRAVMTTTSDRLAEAAREYASGTGRGRLLRFVRERAINGEYAKHLGLVATVRRDFTDLSAMMSAIDTTVQNESKRQGEAYEARVDALIKTAKEEDLLSADDMGTLKTSAAAPIEAKGPIFERIILYIDDLDRCPPDKVVDVLQAVHLLLTFPLFVVIVAVDARWVSRSLEAHYAELLVPDAKAAGAAATARDYLEKIFQVPYWVRPMTPDGSRDLLLSIAMPPPERPKAAANEAGAGDADPAGSRGRQDAPENPTESEARDAGADVGAKSEAKSEERPGRPKDETNNHADNAGMRGSAEATSADSAAGERTGADTAGENVTARALELTNGERAFMHKLAPFVGSTPRRALRFLNVYRVIKASLPSGALHQLEREGGYRGLMMQLGVTTGSPTLRAPWSNFLMTVDPTATLTEIETQLRSEGWYNDAPDSLQLHGALKAFWSTWRSSASEERPGDDGEEEDAVRKVQTAGVGSLRQYDGLAKRYSFGP